MPADNAIYLCQLSDLPEGQSKGLEIDDQALFAVHKQGKYYLYRNQCPHMGIRLEWQDDQFLDIDGNLIQCAMHSALFLIEDGQCIAGPCQGQRLQAEACKAEDGQLWWLPAAP